MIWLIERAAVVLLWILAASFAGSGLMCFLAVTHHWEDREFSVVFAAVAVIFAIFSAAAVYAALAVGRSL